MRDKIITTVLCSVIVGGIWLEGFIAGEAKGMRESRETFEKNFNDMDRLLSETEDLIRKLINK